MMMDMVWRKKIDNDYREDDADDHHNYIDDESWPDRRVEVSARYGAGNKNSNEDTKAPEYHHFCILI